jgi:hypothetical protein
VAEWLGRGLQSLVHRFDSGPRLLYHACELVDVLARGGLVRIATTMTYSAVMAVYEGILRRFSGGNVIGSGGGGTYYDFDSGLIMNRRGPRVQQAGCIRREFVDIGETRINNVVLTPYQDALLQEALGQEVALSMIGPKPDSQKRHTVVAMRTPRGGVNRPSKKKLWAAAIFSTLLNWIVGAVLGTLVFFLVIAAIAWGAYAIHRNWDLFVVIVFAEAVVALGFFVWMIVSPVVNARRVLRAATALDGPPAPDVPTMISEA